MSEGIQTLKDYVDLLKSKLAERDQTIHTQDLHRQELEAKVKELEEDLKNSEMNEETINSAREKLEDAGMALYYAGFWSCDRKVDESALWERLRDALHLLPGTSPKRVLSGEGK